MKTEETKHPLTDQELAQVEGGVIRKPGQHWILSAPETPNPLELNELLGTQPTTKSTSTDTN